MATPVHQPRRMRAVCVGTGVSGLCFAYKLQRSFDNYELTILEKNADIGGVWFENQYPGIACDYPAHNYVYSFAPKADFTGAYAGGQEVRSYFVNFAKTNNLYQYIRFQHKAIKAEWHESSSEWAIDVLDSTSGDTWQIKADIFINACGVLNQWKYPEIPGLKSFKGALMHSANWDKTVGTAGQRVGLIGNGASGQQISAAIQPDAAKLTTFVRQASWVLGSFGEEPRDYEPTEIEAWKADPQSLLTKRKDFETKVNTYFKVCYKDSPEQAGMRKHVAQAMTAKIGPDVRLHDLLIPNYAIGCRRPTPGVKYLESLTAENSEVIMGEIREITETGVVDHTGRLHELDVLICATGFDTSYAPRFPILGHGGVNLQRSWSESPQAYLALAAPGVPNYFVFYGPSNPFASGPFLATVEAQADYMLKWCDRWQTESIASFAPTHQAVSEFYEYAAGILEKLVWSESCSSWYKPKGKAAFPNLWPGSGLHYIETLEDIMPGDWDICFRGNRWRFLGDGFSQTELDAKADKGYYLDVADNTPYLSKQKRREERTRGNEAATNGEFQGFGHEQ